MYSGGTNRVEGTKLLLVATVGQEWKQSAVSVNIPLNLGRSYLKY